MKKKVFITGASGTVGKAFIKEYHNSYEIYSYSRNEKSQVALKREFPNIEIKIGEGRQYVKRSKENYDIIFMSLPSTQQLQSIDNFALSENHLLTVEAIEDYLNNLIPKKHLATQLR